MYFIHYIPIMVSITLIPSLAKFPGEMLFVALTLGSYKTKHKNVDINAFTLSFKF